MDGCKSDRGFSGALSGNATSATKLQTSRTLWGRPFDGTGNVSGALTGVTSITASGQGSFDTLKITDNTSAAHLAFGRSDAFNYISMPGDSSTLAIAPGGDISGAGSALCISNSATYPGYHNGTISLGTSSYRWSNVYSVLGNFSGRITAAGLTSSASIVANAGLSTTTLSASGLIKALDGVQIGSTSDIGWYNHNSRIAAGINTARGVNVGSLLVSSVWSDYTKVPTNGIYSKGEIVCSSDIYPDVTASVKLGSVTKRWLGVYAQNGSFSDSVSVSSLNVVTEATVKTLIPDKLHLPSSLGNEVFDIYVDTEVGVDGETPVSVSFEPLWYGLVSSSGSASKMGGSATVSVTHSDTGYYVVKGVPSTACVIVVPALITTGMAVTQYRYSATVTRIGGGCTVNMFAASDARADYGFYLMII